MIHVNNELLYDVCVINERCGTPENASDSLKGKQVILTTLFTYTTVQCVNVSVTGTF